MATSRFNCTTSFVRDAKRAGVVSRFESTTASIVTFFLRSIFTRLEEPFVLFSTTVVIFLLHHLLDKEQFVSFHFYGVRDRPYQPRFQHLTQNTEACLVDQGDIFRAQNLQSTSHIPIRSNIALHDLEVIESVSGTSKSFTDHPHVLGCDLQTLDMPFLISLDMPKNFGDES